MDETAEKTPHTVRIEGELDFDSVPARLRQSSGWFKQRGHSNTVIDLGGVTRADSAGVALLLDWIRDAKQAGATLHFTNTPPQMRAIIDFCALGHVIPLEQPDRDA